MGGGTLIALLALLPVVVYVHFDTDIWPLLFWNPIVIPVDTREPSDMVESPILILNYSGQSLLSSSKTLLLLTYSLLPGERHVL